MPSVETIHKVEIGSEQIRYAIVRSTRKTTRLVAHPSGALEVRTSEDKNDQWVENLIRRRAQWIFRQLDYFEQFRPRDPTRRYVTGETIRYLGRQYRLKIDQGVIDSVKLRGKNLVVCSKDYSDGESVRRLLSGWYESRARAVFATRMDRCLALVGPHGIDEPDIVIRWMTR